MDQAAQMTHEQRATLGRARLTWLAAMLLVSPLPFVALPLTGDAWLVDVPGASASRVTTLALMFGLAAVGLGMFTRNQAYKAHWVGDAVSPKGYLAGCRRFFVMVVVGALAMFTISLATGYPAPTFAAAPVLIGLLIFSFPNGRPMMPTPPRIGEGTDDDSGQGATP